MSGAEQVFTRSETTGSSRSPFFTERSCDRYQVIAASLIPRCVGVFLAAACDWPSEADGVFISLPRVPRLLGFRPATPPPPPPPPPPPREARPPAANASRLAVVAIFARSSASVSSSRSRHSFATVSCSHSIWSFASRSFLDLSSSCRDSSSAFGPADRGVDCAKQRGRIQ